MINECHSKYTVLWYKCYHVVNFQMNTAVNSAHIISCSQKHSYSTTRLNLRLFNKGLFLFIMCKFYGIHQYGKQDECYPLVTIKILCTLHLLSLVLRFVACQFHLTLHEKLQVQPYFLLQKIQGNQLSIFLPCRFLLQLK